MFSGRAAWQLVAWRVTICFHGLSLLSFLASTIIPLGSEWLLLALLLQGFDPLQSVAVATVGNTLGACTTYWIGIRGGPFLTRRLLGIREKELNRAQWFYRRYGSWSLLLSWLPVVGDPLCLVGGVLQVRPLRFLLLVFSGKLARYTAVSVVTLNTFLP